MQKGCLPSVPILCHFFGNYKTENAIKIYFPKLIQMDLPIVGPAILSLINILLTTVIVPSSFKAAMTKLLGKRGLDPE
jgi:hypothetical protein